MVMAAGPGLSLSDSRLLLTRQGRWVVSVGS